jgi:polyhydroxybutyrate depolymerase
MKLNRVSQNWPIILAFIPLLGAIQALQTGIVLAAPEARTVATPHRGPDPATSQPIPGVPRPPAVPIVPGGNPTLWAHRALRSDLRPPTTPAFPACSGLAGLPGDFSVQITADGHARLYQLHVPPLYNHFQLTPVVLAFHGGGGNSLGIELGSHFISKADAEGFILVRPEGTLDPPASNPDADARYWNGGECCGTASEYNVDDVGFVRAVLDQVALSYCIDPDRIYATGISNGGMMAYRLACQLADRIAAVASVAGSRLNDDLSACLIPCDPLSNYQAMCMGPCPSPPSSFTCNPSRPIPVIEFHGVIDTISPIDGGTGRNDGNHTARPWVSDTIELFRAANHCATTPQVTYLSGEAVCETYGGCSQDADVTLCSIGAGGHTWAGGWVDAPACYKFDLASVLLCRTYKNEVGPISPDISAVTEMWRFFLAHPMQP